MIGLSASLRRLRTLVVMRCNKRRCCRGDTVALAMLFALLLGGCQTVPAWVDEVSEDDVPAVELGMTLEQIEERFAPLSPDRYREQQINKSSKSNMKQSEHVAASPLDHQFTVAKDHGLLMAVSAAFFVDSWNTRFYFVLDDGRVSRITRVPPLESDVANGLPDPKHRVRQVLEMPAVSPEDFRSTVIEGLREYATSRRRYNEPNPALGLALGVGRLLGPSGDDRERHVRKYDPKRLAIGMSREEVLDRLGEPKGTTRLETDRLVVFFQSTGVVFEEGEATEVYSGDFISYVSTEAGEQE